MNLPVWIEFEILGKTHLAFPIFYWSCQFIFHLKANQEYQTHMMNIWSYDPTQPMNKKSSVKSNFTESRRSLSFWMSSSGFGGASRFFDILGEVSQDVRGFWRQRWFQETIWHFPRKKRIKNPSNNDLLGHVWPDRGRPWKATEQRQPRCRDPSPSPRPHCNRKQQTGHILYEPFILRWVSI